MLNANVRALPLIDQRARGTARFLRHFVEMVLAMAVGMMIAGGPIEDLLAGAGYAAALEGNSYPSFVLMVVGMSVTMVAWMRYRGHSWRQAAEMTAAMVIPAAVLVGLDRSLYGPSHLAMLVGMLALMVYRRHEYVHAPVHAYGGNGRH